ncbi:hypothetical protein [Methylorubrum sp. SB2]|uniref:hypothetical protein n=1 Tax=Methylorubrum subtropicum TaxID=3138812 RepID=UPI00313EBCA4
MIGTVADEAYGRVIRLLRAGGPPFAEAPLKPAAAPARAGPDDARPPERLTVVPSTASAPEWDAFAQGCDASFWSSWGGAWMWQLKLHAVFRLRRFDLILTMPTGERRKIGQCAVGVGRRLRVVSDGLVLRPEHADLWPAAMEALLRHLGPGRTVYGSFWSLEPPRHAAITALPDIRVVAVRRLVVEAVDLRPAEPWPDFLRRISRNVVRNAKSFGQAHAGRRFIERHGARCLTLLPAMIGLRARMYDRKQVGFSRTRAVVNYALRGLLLRPYVAMRVSVVGRRPLAAAGTVAFGPSVAFLDGASASHPAGAGWDVLLRVMEDSHRAGRARFLLGYTDVPEDYAGPAWESPVRYRRDCRARGIETSLFAFDYAVAGGGDRTLPPILFERTDPCWTGEART